MSKNTGLKLEDPILKTDVFISELELGLKDVKWVYGLASLGSINENKTRWGMSDEDISKLKKENQRKLPTCVGQTAAKMLEKQDGKDYSARYIYTNTDKIFEKSNKGGLIPWNMYTFLRLFGAVEEKYAPDDNKLSFEEYYNGTPTISNKATKTKIKSQVRIDNNIESIKKALDNLDFVSISVRNPRTRKVKIDGKYIRRFYYNKRGSGGHAMMVTHAIEKDGKFHIYGWNSWGDGPFMLVLQDFPKSSIRFHGGTADTKITKQVEKVVKEKKKDVLKLENFTTKELKGVTDEMAIVLQGIRDVTKRITQKYYGNDKGVPMIITSGKRTQAQNKAVGGVPNSEHLTGEAADIKITSSRNRSIIVQATYIYCYEKGIEPRIGQSWKNNFIHIGIGKNKPKPAAWTY